MGRAVTATPLLDFRTFKLFGYRGNPHGAVALFTQGESGFHPDCSPSGTGIQFSVQRLDCRQRIREA